jgi:putative NADH-flavin reductase
MKIAVIGGTGLTGSVIVPEAANRGHEVTAISRHPEKTAAHPKVTAIACDVFDTERLAGILKGHDWVVHAYSPRNDHDVNRSEPHRLATQSIIDATRSAGVKRLFAIGGAGTLEAAPGKLVMDMPDFPPLYLESARSTAQIKPMLQAQTAFEWTYMSPALFFDMSRGRTGKYRLGGEQPVIDENGKGEISLQDLAVAVVDEIENPRHLGHRFTIGY